MTKRAAKIQSKPGYYLGQVFHKNNPPQFDRYTIVELRYGIDRWEPHRRITIHMEGDMGKLSFQGSLQAPLLEIVFVKGATKEIFTSLISEIEKFRENRHLIF